MERGPKKMSGDSEKNQINFELGNVFGFWGLGANSKGMIWCFWWKTIEGALIQQQISSKWNPKGCKTTQQRTNWPTLLFCQFFPIFLLILMMMRIFCYFISIFLVFFSANLSQHLVDNFWLVYWVLIVFPWVIFMLHFI